MRFPVSLAYVFLFSTCLFLLFLVLNLSSYQRSNPSTTNASTMHEISREEISSVVNVNASVSSKHGAEKDHGVGNSSSSSHIMDFSQNGVHPSDDRTKPDDGVGKKEGSLLTPNQSNQNKGGSQNGKTQPPQKKPHASPNAGKGTRNVKRSQHGKKRLRKKRRTKCDVFEGSWVRDDSYPLYKAGSCPHIDEPFNCFVNGRSDNLYEKFRWQPKNCKLPRLNASNMLEILRGKRLAFVGDSLNRNMWESLVCILGNSVEDKSRMFEASGREEFRTEDSYSFIFKDYNCSIEFFRSNLLVQEWGIPDQKGSAKETLRLDLVERSCDKYKNADVVIFNTGHWWTHDKRMEGKEYYQEGDHIHGQLNVEKAFHKALLTWAKWVDTNIDPKKTIVVFRGYAPSHFMGGEWNSGGQCDNEREPMKNESNLSENPPMMRTIESVVKSMKNPVFYLNITKMTDLRHDAHPSLYRNMNMTEETKRYMLTHQDCSHWCLPGVPDLWNEIVYAHLLNSMKRNKGKPQK